MTPITLPDSVCLNELRIERQQLNHLRVTEYTFAPDHRRELGKGFREGGFIPVFSGTDGVYLMGTKDDENIHDHLAADTGLVERGSIKSFADLPREIARRFVFALIESSAERSGFYKADGWQFFSLTPRFPNGFEGVDVDIRDEATYFGIYVDPTILVLLPVAGSKRSSLHPERPLIRLVLAPDVPRMPSWGHSCHPGWLGYLVGTETVLSDKAIIGPDVPILVRRSLHASDVLRYPAFALRLVATREEIEGLANSGQHRREAQTVPSIRLQRTKDWASRLFPSQYLTVNDCHIRLIDRIGQFEPPKWFPETRLAFDATGSRADYNQLRGLKIHGPFDHNTHTRPFDTMSPYLLVPEEPRVVKKAKQLMEFLASGYSVRPQAIFKDDDFPGITPTKSFRAQFVIPTEQDTYRVPPGSASYEQAAADIVRRWTIQESRSNSRLVVVIVPSIGTEADDPYLKVKRLFVEAGIPSQMMDVTTLNGTQDSSVPFGHTLWVFALDLYVKMGGKPWSLYRPMGNVNCLIGIGFGRAGEDADHPIYVGIANVFDQAGQWLSLSSGDKQLAPDDILSIENAEYGTAGTRSFKLHEDLTGKIVGDALRTRQTLTPRQPASRVVLHKSGRIYESEAIGFLRELSSSLKAVAPGSTRTITRFALVSIYKNHDLRLYGPDYKGVSNNMRNTVSRGSVWPLNDNTAVVATTGKNAYLHIGIGTPMPLIVERYVPSAGTLAAFGFSLDQMYSLGEICEHILALTRLHWGTVRNIRIPVTSEYAWRVARFVARTGCHIDTLAQWKKLWWV